MSDPANKYSDNSPDKQPTAAAGQPKRWFNQEGQEVPEGDTSAVAATGGDAAEQHPTFDNNSAEEANPVVSTEVKSAIKPEDSCVTNDGDDPNKPDKDDEGGVKNYEPGEIVIPPVNYELIHDYKVSATLRNAKGIDMSHSAFGGFTDGDVQEDYLRFLFRDVSNACMSIPYIGGGFIYPALWLVEQNSWPGLQYTAGGIIFLMCNLDLAIHFCIPNPTALHLQVRRICAIFMAIGWVLLTSFMLHAVYDHCEEQNDIIKTWNIAPNRDTATAPRQRQYCTEVTSCYAWVTFTFSMTHMRLNASFCWVLIVIQFVLWQLGRVMPQVQDQMTGTQIGAEMVLDLVGLLFAFGFTYFREVVLQDQFVQSVQLERKLKEAHDKAEQVDNLLVSMVPPSVLNRLLTGEPIADRVKNAGTAFFSDMVMFTMWSSSRSVNEVVELLNVICIGADQIAVAEGCEKIQTIGDAYVCVAGLPDPARDHAERICRFALRYQRLVDDTSTKKTSWISVRFRVGINSGPLIYGSVFGNSAIQYLTFGETCHMAEEVEKAGVPGKVLVTENTAAFLRDSAQSEEFLMAEHSKKLDFHSEDVTGAPTQQEVGLFLVSFNIAGGWGREASFNAREEMESNARVSEHVAKAQLEKEKQARRMFIEARTAAKKQKNKKLRRQKKHSHAPTPGTPALGTGSESPQAGSLVPAGGAGGATAGDPQLGMNGIHDIAELEKFASERKFSWFLLEFANNEDQFQDFARVQGTYMRYWCRAFALAISVALFVSIAIQDGAHNTQSAALMGIGLAINAIMLGTTVFNADGNPTVAFVSSSLLMLGVICTTMGAAWVPNSVATNDLSWLPPIQAAFIASGITNIAAFWRCSLFLCAVTLPQVIIQWNVVMMSADVVFVFLASALVFMILAFTERFLRRQYVEHVLSQAHQHQSDLRAEEQRTLLEAMVPPHVINELQEWIAADQDPTKNIAHTYERVCVAFVTLLPPNDPEERADQLTWLSVAHREVDSVLQELQLERGGLGNSSFGSSNSPGSFAQDNSIALNSGNLDDGSQSANASMTDHPIGANASADDQGSNHGPDHNNNNNNKAAEGGGGKTPVSGGGGGAPSISIPPASPGNDSLAGRSTGSPSGPTISFGVIKIKVIGPNVMLAGPFIDSQSREQAARDMIRLFKKLRIDRGMRIKCGAHMGPVLGGVLGMNRLQFDTFGNTVNVASRTQSNAGADGIAISGEMYDMLEQDKQSVISFEDWMASTGVTFGGERNVAAKGKAEGIRVRSVDFSGAFASPI